MLPLLFFITVHGLRVFQERLSPSQLVLRYGATKMIPWLLHSMRPGPDLVRLLQHPTQPFDYFYEEGCTLDGLLDRDRLDLLLSGVEGRPGWKGALLSVKCLGRARKLLGEGDWTRLGYEWAFTDPNLGKHPFASDAMLERALQATILPSSKPRSVEPDLLNSCNWLMSVPPQFFLTSLSAKVSHPQAWMALHHSCFKASSYATVNNGAGSSMPSRIEQAVRIVEWLIFEVPLDDQMNSSMALRYTIHLTLILHHLQDFCYIAGDMTALPLYKHLHRLAETMNDPLLTRLVLASSQFYCKPIGWQKSKKSLERLPPIKLVLAEILSIGGELTDRQRARWTLDVFELYLVTEPMAGWSGWVEDRSVLEPFLMEAFALVNEVQQKRWIKLVLYSQGTSSLKFLQPTLQAALMASPSLQEYLLGLVDTDLRLASDLMLASVGVDRRLKEARRRFFESPFLVLRVQQISRLFNPTGYDLDLSKVVGGLKGYLSDGLMQVDPSQWSLALLKPSRMAVFGFVMAMAGIFRIPVGFRLDEGLLYGLLGFDEGWLDLDWNKGGLLGQYFQHVQTSSNHYAPVDEIELLDPFTLFCSDSSSSESGDSSASTGGSSARLTLVDLLKRLEMSITASHQILYGLVTWGEIRQNLYK